MELGINREAIYAEKVLHGGDVLFNICRDEYVAFLDGVEVDSNSTIGHWRCAFQHIKHCLYGCRPWLLWLGKVGQTKARNATLPK